MVSLFRGEWRNRELPSPNRYSWDLEEEELALIYQNKRTFAIGHGCAPMWSVSEAKTTVHSVETSFVPRYEVPPSRPTCTMTTR